MAEQPEELPASALLEFLCDPGWFDEQAPRQIFVRYYVPVLVGSDHLRRVNTFEQYEIGAVPIRMVIAHISGQDYVSHHPAWTSTDTGDSALVIEAFGRRLPDSLYVLLATPLAPVQDWTSAARTLDRMTSLLRHTFGTNFVFSLAREAIVDVPNGNMVTPSPVIPTPQHADGPWLGSEHRAHLHEVLTGLAGSSREVSDRALFALELFERAGQQAAGSKFLYYWIGVEVLCGTHGMQSILSKLERAYGDKRSYLQNTLGFTQIWRMRTELFHHGQQHDMPQDVERYVQAMFMDLMRFEIGIPCRRLMEKMIGNGFQIERLKREVGKSHVLNVDITERVPPRADSRR